MCDLAREVFFRSSGELMTPFIIFAENFIHLNLSVHTNNDS